MTARKVIPLEESCADYLAAFEVALDDPDATLAEENDALKTAFAKTDKAARVEQIISTAQQGLTSLRETQTMNIRNGGAFADMLAQLQTMRVRDLRLSIDRALIKFDDQQLTTAETELTELRDRFTAVQQQLSAAVDDDDVETVTRLRTTLEMSLPRQIEQAEAVVAEHRVARAEAELVRMREHHAAAVTVMHDRERDRIAAWDAFQAASTEELAASGEASGMNDAVTAATSALHAARAEVDRLTTHHATARDARKRRLAGLPA